MIEAIMILAGVVVMGAFVFVCAQSLFDAAQRRAYDNKKKWDEENR
jgi:alpha-glucuronidase